MDDGWRKNAHKAAGLAFRFLQRGVQRVFGGNWWRIYARRNLASAVIGIAGTVLTLWWAYGLFSVSEPPRRQEVAPSIQLGGHVPLFEDHGLKGFDADVRLTVNGCRNPVNVFVDILLTGPKADAEVAYYTTSSPAKFSGFVGDPTHTARDFSVRLMTPGGWQHAFTDPASSSSGVDYVTWRARAFGSKGFPFPLLVGERDRDPSSREFDLNLPAIFAATGVHTLPRPINNADAVRHFDLAVATIEFQVDWISHRSRGTCYVYLPEVYSDPLEGADAFVAGSGSVRLEGQDGGSVDPIRSVPPPTDSRGPYWRCPLKGFTPDSPKRCGGVAVFEKRGADSDLGFKTFLAGAVVALFLALMFESLLKFRRPPRT